MFLTKVSTSMIGGSVNSSSDLSNWVSSGELYCGIGQAITLSSNITIPYTKTVTFLPGGLIIVPTGITLTINAQIVAGDQQIFQCTGTGKVVATNNQNGTGYYPIQTSVVKAIWFGVIPDAQFPTNTVPNPAFTGNIALGTTPSGTDSTAALQMAVAYCQYLCVKGGQALYVTTTPTLQLPAGQIYVQGNNVLGNQIFTDQVASVYATAAAGGNPLTNTYMVAPYYLNSNSYNVLIDGKDCMILWKINSSSDVFWNTTFLTGKVHAKNFSVVPIMANDNMGVFLYNLGLCTKGTISNYTNNFGNCLFENVNVQANIDGAYSGAAQVAPGSTPSAFLSKVFWMDGYSRADNITISEGFYNTFHTFWQGDNPESVDLRFINNAIQMDVASSAAFVFTSFYDGFVASGNFFSFKANNTSLIQELNVTTQYIGSSYYDQPIYYFLGGQRYEFLTGLTGVNICTMYSGMLDVEGLNIGTGGLPTTATDAILSNTGNAIFRNCRVSGAWKIANNYSQSQPAVTYDNCQSFLNGNMGNESTWQQPGTGAAYDVYRNVIANTSGYVPSIRYINQQGGSTSLPLPEYYGNQTSFWQNTTAEVIDRSIDNYARWGTGNTYFLLPPLCKITSIKLYTESGSFTSINIVFGKGTGGNPTYTFTTSLAGTAQYGLELIPNGQCLIAPTSNPDFLYFKPTAYNSSTAVPGGVKGWLQFTYAAVINAQDVLPTLGNDVVVQQAIV